MDLTGQYRILAPRDRVWQALNDPQVLQVCIPGCEELLKLSDTEYRARVTARVGAMKASFSGIVTLSDLDPPNGYTISGQGDGGAAGFAQGRARVTLDGAGVDTVLAYNARADVGGKLASVGNRLLQGVAAKTADDFFARFAEVLSGGAPAAPPAKAEVPAGRVESPLLPAATQEARPGEPVPPAHVAELAPKAVPSSSEDNVEPIAAAKPGPTTQTIVIACGAVAYAIVLVLLFFIR